MNTITTSPVIAANTADVSRHVLRDGQAESGAYIASPNFTEYAFGWLRDGAYCALAADAVGDLDSSGRFHAWVATVIEARVDRIRTLVARLERGETPAQEEMLPTRYTLDGADEGTQDDAWPNFQLDGYGTWLFALHAHARSGGDVSAFMGAVAATADYLGAAWRMPCYDYWEEFGDRQHTSTLLAIAAGLRAAARLLDRAEHDRTADAILAFVKSDCVVDGSLVKGPDDHRVDASLISAATPFGLFSHDDPLITGTIARVRTELATSSGGIRRYLGDTYYGGNPWLLLTAWLGWHDRTAGNLDGYERARAWVLAHRTAEGWMPEQIMTEPQDVSKVQPWIDRWGPVASPLLWSHAKFLLMESSAGIPEWS